mmetsp:Transcript_13303/g.49394  ORF Transcript_13303/g.49394 Transcript_13303/m.49394 type:complete len:1381 (-) Transcript_13303:102-4244(-)
MGAARSNLNRVRKEAPKDLKWAEDVRDAPAPRWWTVAQQQNHVFRGKELRLGQQALEDSDVELLVDFTLPQLPKLRELKLDGNNLSDSGVVLLFERGIHRCPKLRRLYLDNNAHVTDKVNRSVAEVLLARPHGALDYVSGVDLRAAAHILRIPQHLARLDKENDPGIGKQREANYEILRFLREREKDGGGVHAAVAKVLVTGPEGAGKTSLVHHLLWDGDFLGKQARPTHGLEVTDWHTTSQELRFYDFSGQQVYAHTRRLWLATNGVFVLVWRPTRNMNAAAQLVDYVRDVVNDAPEAQLLLVSTHADEAGTAPLSPKALKAAVSALPPRAAERVAGYFHVSSKTGQGMKELRCRIEELARGLPYMSEEPPAAYERLRSRIEEMAKTDGTFLLTNSEWQELAAECGVEGHRDALNFLHNCGTLMKLSSQQCPGNSQEAAGLVVIQPKKLDEVLRRVIASTPTARSHVRNGVLRHRDLEQVWPSSLCPPRLHSAMLRFLHAAELGFPIVTEEYGDHHETLLPSMLDGESESISESAAQLYDDLRSRYSSLEENGTVDVTLSTMPRHFGAQLHVQLRPFAVDFGWSANGCVLALKNEDQEVAGCARAVFRYGAKTVRIESFGSISLRHEILSGVVRLLENSFKGIVVKNMTVSYTDGELVADQWSLTELRRLARAGEDSILCDACEIEKELVLTDVLWFLAKVSEKVDYTPMLAHAQSAMRPSSTSDLFDEDGPDVEASPTISAAFSETLDQFMERGVTNDFDVAFFLQQLVAPTDQQILRTCALRCFNWLRGPHANSRRLCMEAIWLLYRRAVGHDTQYVAYPLRPRFMGRWTLSPEDAVPISSGSASLLPADGSDQEEAQQVQSIFERMVTIMEIPEDRHRDVFEGVIFSREPLTAEELHAMAKASASYCWAPSAKIHVHPYDLPEFTNENAMMSFPSVRPNFDAASQQADSIFAVHRALGSMEQILESLQGSDDQPEEEIGELPHGRDLGDALRDTAHTLALIEEQREMLEGIFSGSLCGNDVALLSKAEDVQESLYAWRRVMRRRLLLVTTSIAEVEGSYGGLVPDDQAPVESQQQQQQQLLQHPQPQHIGQVPQQQQQQQHQQHQQHQHQPQQPPQHQPQHQRQQSHRSRQTRQQHRQQLQRDRAGPQQSPSQYLGSEQEQASRTHPVREGMATAEAEFEGAALRESGERRTGAAGADGAASDPSRSSTAQALPPRGGSRSHRGRGRDSRNRGGRGGRAGRGRDHGRGRDGSGRGGGRGGRGGSGGGGGGGRGSSGSRQASNAAGKGNADSGAGAKLSQGQATHEGKSTPNGYGRGSQGRGSDRQGSRSRQSKDGPHNQGSSASDGAGVPPHPKRSRSKYSRKERSEARAQESGET